MNNSYFVRFTQVGLVLLLSFPGSLLLANGWEHTAIPLPALISALSDQNADIRQKAAHSLGHHSSDNVAKKLLQVLDDGEQNTQVRQAIFGALGKIGYAGSFDAVNHCLAEETEVSVRTVCATVLETLGTADAEHAAILATNDPHHSVRLAAINVLGSYNSNRVIHVLTDFLGHEQQSVRLAAIRAVGRTAHPTAFDHIEELIDTDTEATILVAALKAVTKLSGNRARSKIQQVFSTTPNERVKRFALIALAATDSNGIRASLENALSSDDPLMIIQSLEIIRDLKDTDLLPAVIRHAMGFSQRFYSQSALAIESNANQAIIDLSVINEFLRTVIAIDPHHAAGLFALAAKPPVIRNNKPIFLHVAQGIYQARWQATYGIGYTHAGDADEVIYQGFASKDARLRAIATRSMGVNDPTRFRELTLKAMQDNNAEVRWQAAVVMGRDPSITDLSALLKATSDPYSRVRKEAALSLGYVAGNNKEARERLQTIIAQDADPEVRASASYALKLLMQKE